jgi:enoyl-[acyl-carrier protein] reductase/trans-2-enoyl-CoA reductase (NAD+)
MRAKCKNQIKYVQSKGAIAGGKKVLVIDFYRFWFSFKDFKCFGSDAATIGALRNRLQKEEQPPGWYNSAAFEKEAKKGFIR